MGGTKWFLIGLAAFLVLIGVGVVITLLLIAGGRDEPDVDTASSVSDSGAGADESDEATGDSSDDDEPMTPADIFRAALDNTLQTKSLAYSYEYENNYEYDIPPGVAADDGAEGSVTGVSTIEYEFKGQDLDNPERRIIWQSVKLEFLETVDTTQAETDFVLELQTIHHQDNIYVALVDMTPTEYISPSGSLDVIDAVKDNWLKFTKGKGANEGVWLETSSEDYRLFEGTDIGRLLGFLHDEMNGVHREETELFVLNLLGTFSYADSPFAFGHLEDSAQRQRISDLLVRFIEEDAASPKPFVVEGCVQDSAEQVSCQFSATRDSTGEEQGPTAYAEILDLVQLSDVLPVPSQRIWSEARLEHDDIESYQASAVIDAERNLPLSFTSKTTYSRIIQAGEESTEVRGAGAQTTSYETFNQDLELNLPEKIRRLPDLLAN